ncbi:uncharacterized protein [Watersipora subatra]|uniref:uncharacterized protein isoform X1 n=1 Tax=Watersipora subatra TaxID=2589382 RepID=UPI00355B8D4C
MFFNPGLKFLLIAFVTLGIWVHATAGQDNTTQPINSILNATITVAEIKHQNQTGTTLSSPNATTSDRTTPQSEVNGTQSMTTTSPPTSTAYTSSNSVTTVLESQRLNGTTVTTAGLKTSAATLGISDGAHSDSEVIRTSAISSLAITNITDPTSTMPISTTHSGGSTSITDSPSTAALLTTKDSPLTDTTEVGSPDTTSSVISTVLPTNRTETTAYTKTSVKDTTSERIITTSVAHVTTSTTLSTTSGTKSSIGTIIFSSTFSRSQATTQPLQSITPVSQTTRALLTTSVTRPTTTPTFSVTDKVTTRTGKTTTSAVTKPQVTTAIADSTSKLLTAILTNTAKITPQKTTEIHVSHPISMSSSSFPTSNDPASRSIVSIGSTQSSSSSATSSVGLAMTSTCGTTCSIKCELGRKVDDKGCPLCACVDSSDMPANIEKILQEFWWIFLIAVLILIIVIIIVAVWCWYKKRNIEQQERERVARHCPTDTMLKANSAFHLALQQQSTAYNDDDTLEVQRRYRADISNNVLAGPEDRETVFDDFHNEQQMKSFFQMSQRKQEHSPESVRSTNKQTQTSTACGENRMLPDVVGSSALHSFNDDEIEPDLHFKASQDSFDGIDYHRSMPGTPTKLTEL